MTRKLLVILTIGLVGCSGDDEEGGPCEEREGVYRSSYSERSGNCGSIPESVDIIRSQPTRIERPCSGRIYYTESNCRVAAEYECPEEGNGPDGRSYAEFVVDWDRNGDRGEGLFEIRATGRQSCWGTYDVIIVRE